jgi:hypothetical protein
VLKVPKVSSSIVALPRSCYSSKIVLLGGRNRTCELETSCECTRSALIRQDNISNQNGDRGRKLRKGDEIDLGVEMEGWRRSLGIGLRRD